MHILCGTPAPYDLRVVIVCRKLGDEENYVVLQSGGQQQSFPTYLKIIVLNPLEKIYLIFISDLLKKNGINILLFNVIIIYLQ